MDKIHVAYCPERVLPGNVIYELVHNDRVIGGRDEASTAAAQHFYSQFVQGQLHPTNCKTAEMCKLTENWSRDSQIAFANELSIICDKAGNQCVGAHPSCQQAPRVNIPSARMRSGRTLHCRRSLLHFNGVPAESKMISTAREVNNYKAFWCAEKVKNAILKFELDNKRKPVVAMMGLAFKPDIDDLRESPSKYIATRVMPGLLQRQHSHRGAEHQRASRVQTLGI